MPKRVYFEIIDNEETDSEITDEEEQQTIIIINNIYVLSTPDIKKLKKDLDLNSSVTINFNGTNFHEKLEPCIWDENDFGDEIINNSN